MRIPWIPLLVACVLVGAFFFVFTQTGPTNRSLDSPLVTALIDVVGVESEIAISPDGLKYAVISSGDLWLVDDKVKTQVQLTDTAGQEFAPRWTPNGDRITFSRGVDTFEINPKQGKISLFLGNATDLTWSSDQRIAFIREHSLWISDGEGLDSKELVPADGDPNVTIRSPRFSPDSKKIVFIKSMLNVRGEVWLVDLDTENSIPIIADRNAENPTAVDWILDNRHIVYLTDRSGGIAVWYLDMNDNTLLPLTSPMMGLAMMPLGIAVSGERVILPRHFIDSNISTSSGISIVATDLLEFEPSLSPDGNSIVYCVENEGRFELWKANINGDDIQYLTLGREPRFSPNGNEVVYTRVDLDGNKDIWKIDTRTGIPERLTDAEELDMGADWSPDGRFIIFSSERGGELALWSIPASGGKRLKLNGGGYGPRFSPDGTAVLYWHRGNLWVAGMDGGKPQLIAPTPRPTFGLWLQTEPVFFTEGAIRNSELTPFFKGNIFPWFDHHPDTSWIVSSIKIEKTDLWALDLQFKEN